MGRGRRVALIALALWFWGSADASSPADVGDGAAATLPPVSTTAWDASACTVERTEGPLRDADAGPGATTVSFVLLPPGCAD